MKRILIILSAVALAATAGSVRLAWDASPSPGVTNYIVKAGTNSVQTASTNWLAVSTGTNRTVKVEALNAGRWYFHAVAVADGVESDPSNEVQVEFPAPPANARTVAIEATLNLASTNWSQLGFFRLRFLNP